MKDSGVPWIGLIPCYWDVQPIKYLTQKIGSGKTPSGGAETYTDTGVIFLRSQNIYNTGLELSDVSHISEQTDLEMQNSRVRYNDVLLNITGGSIGRCCIFTFENTPANVNQHVCIIRADTDKLRPQFLRYFWNSSAGSKVIDQYQTGANRPALNFEQIGNTRIPLCSIEMQDKIIQYLDNKCSQIDEIITEAKASIEDLRAYELSVISGTTITQEWSVLNLRHCIQNIEQGWSSPPAEAVDEENGWFVLSLSAVKRGAFYAQARKPIDANAKIPENLELHKNDFLMTRSNTRELVGDVCVVDADAEHTIFSDLIYRITFNEKLLPQYAKYLLRSSFVRQQIQSAAQGTSSSMPKISHKVIKGLKVPVPSCDEQTKIAKYLDSVSLQINVLIAEKEALIADLEAYKKSLIYEAVTGKRKVV